MSALPTTLIFVFDETGELAVHSTAEAACIACEWIDAESGVFKFYDARGQALRPELVNPGKPGKLFGIFQRVNDGPYVLVSNDEPVDSFALALFEAQAINDNPWFKSLEELKTRLRANGVEVDFQLSR